MKKLISCISISIIALAFQNCGTNLSTASLQEDVDLASQQKNAVVVDQAIPPSPGEFRVLKLLESSALKVRFHGRQGEYEIDLRTGVARRNGANKAKVIFNTSLRSQFVVALHGADICEQDPKAIPSTLACTMIASEPYARLETKGTSIELGRQTSGCTWVQDLCARNRKAFVSAVQNFIDINENLSSPY